MLLYLKIKPNQRFDRIEKSGSDWQIRLKAPAIDGKANEQLIKYLSELLGLPKSKIVLKKGQSSRIKCIEIDAETDFVNLHLEKAFNESAQ
jgi:uncharacterized protein (TIGR00251 family)